MDAPPDIVIRRLRPADGGQLAALLRDAFAEEFDAHGPDLAALRRQVRALAVTQLPGIHHILDAGGAPFVHLVAAHQGRIVGSTAVGGARLQIISSVAVHPDYRGLGIARALLRRAHAEVLATGRDRVALDVLAHNTPAFRLYETLGYREFHRYRSYELPALPAGPTPDLPRGYWLEPPTRGRRAAFPRIERAALPARYFNVAPTLRDRYLRGPAGVLLERLAGNVHAYRRALIYQGRVTGYLLAVALPGQTEGRIEYPLLPVEATPALPAALADAIRFLEAGGRVALRLDLSEDRPDQHAVAEALGLRHRWTYIQMALRPLVDEEREVRRETRAVAPPPSLLTSLPSHRPPTITEQ